MPTARHAFDLKTYMFLFFFFCDILYIYYFGVNRQAKGFQEGIRYPKTILLGSWAYMHFGLGLEFFWDLLIEELNIS